MYWERVYSTHTPSLSMVQYITFQMIYKSVVVALLLPRTLYISYVYRERQYNNKFASIIAPIGPRLACSCK